MIASKRVVATVLSVQEAMNKVAIDHASLIKTSGNMMTLTNASSDEKGTEPEESGAAKEELPVL